MFGLDQEFAADGSQFDRLWRDGDRFDVGDIAARVIATPGHTPDSVSYLIGDNLFVGDTLFIPEMGTARCDFPGASSRDLYASVRRLHQLPGATRVFVGHDYPQDREPVHSSDVASERRENVHLSEATRLEDFVAFREQRDRTLPLPDSFYFALQVNVRAGRLPLRNAEKARFFRVPIQVAGRFVG